MASIGGKKLSLLRVVDLRAELETRNLNKSGLKATLVKRLENSLLEEATDLFDTDSNHDETDCNGDFADDSIAPRITCEDKAVNTEISKDEFQTIEGLGNDTMSKLVAAVCSDQHGNTMADVSTATIGNTTEEAGMNEHSCRECQSQWHNFTAEFEGIKLDNSIAEAKFQTQLSGIRNENAELRRQIERVNDTINMNTNRTREAETNKTFMMDYIDVLKTSLLGWKERACKAETKYEALVNNHNKAENTSISQQQVGKTPICIITNNQCTTDKEITQPQPENIINSSQALPSRKQPETANNEQTETIINDCGNEQKNKPVMNKINRLNTAPTPKHMVPCPFLGRKGHCLKGPNCDFSHDFFQQQSNRYYDQQHRLPQSMYLPNRYPIHFPYIQAGNHPPPLMEIQTRPPRH